jgi:hypothetical protein
MSRSGGAPRGGGGGGDWQGRPTSSLSSRGDAIVTCIVFVKKEFMTLMITVAQRRKTFQYR